MGDVLYPYRCERVGETAPKWSDPSRRRPPLTTVLATPSSRRDLRRRRTPLRPLHPIPPGVLCRIQATVGGGEEGVPLLAVRGVRSDTAAQRHRDERFAIRQRHGGHQLAK